MENKTENVVKNGWLIWTLELFYNVLNESIQLRKCRVILRNDLIFFDCLFIDINKSWNLKVLAFRLGKMLKMLIEF